MSSSDNSRKTVVLVVAVLALLVAALTLASCGRNTTTGTNAGMQTAERQAIDGYVQELDRSMNSVSETDFNEGRLSDTEIGL